MVLTSSHKSGSPLTLWLVFVLCIVFLAPLYHSHNHVADHHPENSDDHVSIHDGAGHEGLSVDPLHNDSHLHIRKDIGRTEDHQRFRSRSLEPDLCAITDFLIIAEHSLYTIKKHVQTFIFRSNTYACLSGLSPPVA
jgi:hypothetical protein